jgi:hypothetical protein
MTMSLETGRGDKDGLTPLSQEIMKTRDILTDDTQSDKSTGVIVMKDIAIPQEINANKEQVL